MKEIPRLGHECLHHIYFCLARSFGASQLSLLPGSSFLPPGTCKRVLAAHARTQSHASRTDTHPPSSARSLELLPVTFPPTQPRVRGFVSGSPVVSSSSSSSGKAGRGREGATDHVSDTRASPLQQLLFFFTVLIFILIPISFSVI